MHAAPLVVIVAFVVAALVGGGVTHSRAAERPSSRRVAEATDSVASSEPAPTAKRAEAPEAETPRETIDVFVDAVENDWRTSEWNDTAHAIVDVDGDKKLEVRFTKAWGGFTIDHRTSHGVATPFDADALAAVELEVEGDKASLEAVCVMLDNGSARQPLARFRRGKTVSIPMDVLNDARAPIRRLAFFNASRSGGKRVVLDDIRYVRAAKRERTAEERAPRAVTIVVDQTKTFAISPYVYGDNAHDAIVGVRFARQGGNRWSTYNYTNNASNSGVDWGPHSNDGYLSRSSEPAEPVLRFIRTAHRGGAATLVTVPMLDWVAADKAGLVRAAASVANPRFVSSSADGDHTTLRQDRFVALVERARGDATVFWSLDNEPALWPSTHPLVHPTPTTYAEMADRTTRFARMVKRVAPASLVFFGVAYGYAEFVNLQQASDGGGRDYLEFLLDTMAEAERVDGVRVGDVLDVHWYPEVRAGSGRITGSQRGDPSDDEIVARVQAPRSLWDPTYDEKTWITRYAGGPVRLLPSLRDKIARRYPGTKLAITEYNYGGGEHVSGAVAQADVLGVFGREGVFAANVWWHHFQERGSYVHEAFRMYLDIDGAGRRVGDTGLAATVSDVEAASAYAFLDDGGARQLVLINKSFAPLDVTIRLTPLDEGARFTARELTGESKAPRAASDTVATAGALARRLPPLSVTTLVEWPRN